MSLNGRQEWKVIFKEQFILIFTKSLIWHRIVLFENFKTLSKKIASNSFLHTSFTIENRRHWNNIKKFDILSTKNKLNCPWLKIKFVKTHKNTHTHNYIWQWMCIICMSVTVHPPTEITCFGIMKNIHMVSSGFGAVNKLTKYFFFSTY